jgi:hypothetical protein
MAGKRHHFLSQFLLRRFAETSGKREGLVWRLDKKTGQSRPVAPKYEAALRHYYRLEYEDGTTDSRPEDVIARIEEATAAALRQIERGELPDDEDRAWLALFVILQHRRTPVAREWQRFRDELMSTMMAEVTLGNVESFHRRAQVAEPSMTQEQVEEMRLEMLEDLQSGRVKLGSTPSREAAFMFVALDEVAKDLVEKFTWIVVRAPTDAELVLPGMGISLYDPTPPNPHSGFGFRSSPNSQTLIPVDPRFALALTPGEPVWREADASVEDVDEMNLRAYAWSDAACYGRSQKVVTDLRALARRNRGRVGELAPRPGRIWITEGEADGPETGEFEFTGHSPTGSVRRRFIVKPGAFEGVKPFRG